MGQNLEHCAKCGKLLDIDEQAFVYEGKVVCYQCNQFLRRPTNVTPTKSKSGFGSASLVLGIFACLPIFGISSLTFALLGILFGIIGIKLAKQKKTTNINLPVAGTIISCIAFCLFIINTDSVDFSPDKGKTTTMGINNNSLATIGKEGETIHVGYTSYVVWRSRWSNILSKNRPFDYLPNAKYLFVELTVRNDDTKARMVPPFKLIDENGAEYETSSNGWHLENSFDVLESLNPSVSKRGIIVFDTPKEHNYRLKISGGYWSTEDAYIQLEPKENQ